MCQRHRFTAAPGTIIRYTDIADGQPPLLLVHGSYGSAAHWDANVEQLATYGRVIVPDLPGFGGSGRARPGADLGYFAEALRRVLDEARLGACALAAFSFGGLVATEFARLNPERALALVLLSPPIWPEPPPEVTEAQARASEVAMTASLEASVDILLREILLFNPHRRDLRAQQLVGEQLRRTRFRARDLLRKSGLVEMLSQTVCPTLVVLGAEDPFFRRRLPETLARIGASRAGVALQVVPDGGHWLCYDRPDMVNRLIIEFTRGATAWAAEPDSCGPGAKQSP